MMVERLLIFVIIILPFQFALNVGPSADLVITRILTPLVFLFWFFRGLAKKEIYFLGKIESFLVAMFLALAAFSLVWGLGWESGVRKLIYFLSIVPLYFTIANVARNDKWKRNISRAVVISGGLGATVAIFEFSLQFILGLEKTLSLWREMANFFLGSSFGELVLTNPSWLVGISGKTILRAFGFFADPHVFSFFASLCFFTALGYMYWEENKAWRKAVFASATLMAIAVFLSFSRGAYLGGIAGILFFFVVYLRRSGSLKRFLALGVAVLLASTLFFSGAIFSRFSSIFNTREGSNAERIENWKQALELIKAHPLTGVGLGNYSHAVNPLAPSKSSIYAHNVFLDVSAETGLVNGFVFLFLILISFLRNVYAKNPFGLGLASALIYFVVHGIFDTPLFAPQVLIILLIILALGHAPAGEKSLATLKK